MSTQSGKLSNRLVSVKQIFYLLNRCRLTFSLGYTMLQLFTFRKDVLPHHHNILMVFSQNNFLKTLSSFCIYSRYLQKCKTFEIYCNIQSDTFKEMSNVYFSMTSIK